MKNNIRNLLLYGGLFASMFLLVYVVGYHLGGESAREKFRADHKPQPFTGQQLFDEINRVRADHELEPFTLSWDMCDDLGSRYNTIKSIYDRTGELSHQGFAGWANEKHPDNEVIELITTSPTLKNSVEGLLSSPGHRLPLLNPDYDEACTFAEANIGVILIKVE